MRPLIPMDLTGGRRVDAINPLSLVVGRMVTQATEVGPGVSLVGPGWFEISLPVPQFNSTELAVFSLPSLPSGVKAPLLVVCHSFGVSHGDVLFNTTFFEETQDRNWFMLAPLSRSPDGPGGGDINYGSAASQEFTFEALQYVLDNYPIDRERIYAVGFSMGAAQASSYGVRHLDPRDGIFAALVAHTGSLDQTDTWLSAPPVRPIMETIFGDTPAAEPFPYRNASVLEIDPMTGSVDPTGVNQIVNLLQTPIQLWWAPQDPEAYLVDQTTRLGTLLFDLQAPVVDFRPVFGVSDHLWSTLSETEVCDWLTPHSLSIPREGRVIADRDARWFFFDVEGIAPESFGQFTFDVDLGNGRIGITQSEGIDTVETNLARWNDGVAQPLPLNVVVEAVDQGDTLILRNVTDTPITVLRDGVSQATGWLYDPVRLTLTITELATGLHSWNFLP